MATIQEKSTIGIVYKNSNLGRGLYIHLNENFEG